MTIDRSQRPSPSVSATLFSEGTTGWGNDKNQWIVVTNTNGVKRWKKINNQTKKTKSAKSRSTKSRSRRTSKKKTTKSRSRRKSRKQTLRIEAYQKQEKNEKIYITDQATKKANVSSKKLVDNKEDLKAYFLQDETGKIDKEVLETSKKWGNYFKPAFEELTQHGIISFIYPTGSVFVDDAEADTQSKIAKSDKIVKFIENYWGIHINRQGDYYYSMENVPAIWYLFPGTKATQVYVKFNLPLNEQRESAYKVFKKHYGNNYSWNKQENRAMLFVMKGEKEKKELSFIDLFLKKLRQDGIDFKVLKKGNPYGKGGDYDLQAVSSIKFKGDTSKLEKLLKDKNKYNIYNNIKLKTKKKSKTYLKQLNKEDREYYDLMSNPKFVSPDYIKIDKKNKILYVNFASGMPSATYLYVKN